MFDFHEKRKIRNVLYSWPVVIVLLFLTVLLSASAFNHYSVTKELKAKLEVKEAELSEMESRARVIETKVEYLKNERGIEEELRNNFDAIKEGEQAVIIINNVNKERVNVGSEAIQTDSSDAESDSNFLKTLKFWE